MKASAWYVIFTNGQYHQTRGVVFNLDSHVGFGSRKRCCRFTKPVLITVDLKHAPPPPQKKKTQTTHIRLKTPLTSGWKDSKNNLAPSIVFSIQSVFPSSKASWWFQVSTHLKNISQIGSFPQFSGVKIKTYLKPPPGKSSVPNISFRFEGIRSTSANSMTMKTQQKLQISYLWNPKNPWKHGGFSAPQIWAVTTKDEGCVGSLVEPFLS